MPPILYDYLFGIIRAVLAGLLGTLVAKGWATQDTTTQVITWLAGITVIALWSIWQKYGAKLLQVTAQTMPAGVSQAAVQAKINSGAPLPSVMTGANTVPVSEAK